MSEGESENWKKKLKALGIVRERRGGTSRTDRRKLVAGREGEDRAAALLEEKGLRILGRNVRYRDGEIDLVAEEGDTFVFVEVKRRRDAGRGTSAEAITARKRARLTRAARRWLKENRVRTHTGEIRFDVVAIHDDPPTIEWLRGAFDASH